MAIFSIHANRAILLVEFSYIQEIPMKLFSIFFILLTSLCQAEDKTPVFPVTCQESCITPFGTKLGKTAEGIESYSNCKPNCIYMNPTFVENTFAGIQWQCVEFARRWLMVNKTLTFESIDIAADLWNKIDHLVNFKTKATVPLKNNPNGSPSLPKQGDLIIYAREYLNTGHVVIVTKTDTEKQLIYIAEQNYSNDKWPSDYARTIPFTQVGKSYWLLDPYLIGWKSY